MQQILFKGGLLADGTGGPPRAGDLLIAGERIEEIGKFSNRPQERA